jgi:SecD/SecF fusion protein
MCIRDRLKGFGVSLTAGLVISLFTSLYMTRLMFDIWQANGWLTKLTMLKLLDNPNFGFMRIRKYWLTATVGLTLLGTAVFLIRGSQGLNIDFTGGTLYGAKLADPVSIGDLRTQFSDGNQRVQLKVKDVQQLDDDGLHFGITYDDKEGARQNVQLTNAAAGATKQEREADVKRRAEQLPDWSVEQIFPSNDVDSAGQPRKRPISSR